jgi:lipopolysaccharide transport system ATP-binding protein
MAAPVLFDGVSKKFSVGQRHDSLRDLIPSLVGRFARGDAAELGTREFWAVNDVSFEVKPGDALGIIGRNGAGKSTVLKILTRILKPTRGRSLVTGRTGALIEVAAGFHPDLTGRENIFLQGAIMGMRRGEITRRFDQIVEFAGVERFLDTPVKRYSSGMNARLGFSIAAHLNPDVLLIDEVLAVGDMAFQERCHERLMAFRKDGVAIVFVSHHLPAVARLCSHTLLLEQGRVAQFGKPAEVIAAYCGGAAVDSTHEVTLVADLRSLRPSKTDVFDIAPGATLQLDVTVGFRIDVERAMIGVVVWDTARDLYVYGASSDFAGIPPIRARCGDSRRFSFTFVANLTRGLYAIELNVYDLERQQFLAVSKGIRHFQVTERNSYGGVANLYLAAHEATPDTNDCGVERTRRIGQHVGKAPSADVGSSLTSTD